MRPWKPILAALVIFTAGVAIGHLAIPTKAPSDTQRRRELGSGDRRGPERRGGQPGRPPWSPVMSEEQIGGICGRMTRDLKLTATQSNDIMSILRESQVRMKVIADDFLPRTRNEFLQTREAIKGVLTEEQRQTFEEGFKRRQSHEGRPPREGQPPPPPPEPVGATEETPSPATPAR